AAVAVLTAVAVAVVAPFTVLADERPAERSGGGADGRGGADVGIGRGANARADGCTHSGALDAIVARAAAQDERRREQDHDFAAHCWSPQRRNVVAQQAVPRVVAVRAQPGFFATATM